MPARATLTCSFKARVEGDENFSADVAKTHVVRRGDRISGIARAQYSDASLWRPIADANRIKDPLRLPVGRTLLIPSLTPSTRSR
ncbi:Peptidoglycan-binding LysM (fragment) [Candidatus Sulfopaludibacter sp. SbA3]